MSLYSNRWQVAPAAPPSHIARFPDLHPVIVQVLYNRGITDRDTAAIFLSGEGQDVNPFSLPGMSKAVTRLRRALRNNETIAVYGDFDADGVSATALLVQTLQALDGRALPYIPHRVDEGYGLNGEALTHLAREGADVVITVDCGIRAFEEVERASGLGLDIIVTDHHSVGRKLPDAVAVIDPKRADNDGAFNELAGVGVAYRLAQALLRTHQQIPVTDREVSLQEEELLDLVALGTVADMVPLQDDNRALVHKGLERINQMARPGLQALCEQAGLKSGDVDATAIGFRLGPRINAAGRLVHAKIAYQLLATQELDKAKHLAGELDKLNRQRQQLTREAQEQARQLIRETDDEAPLLFAAARDFQPGIVGLVASRLLDEFYRPAVVVEVGPEESHGSCRSIPDFHITQALEACDDLLIRYGGHAAAAGFTVTNDKLTALSERLQQLAADQLADVELTPVLPVDAEIDLSQMSWELQKELSQLEPCGYANPQPLFVSRSAHVVDHRAVGREKRHLKLTLSNGQATWDAIAFRQGEWAGKLPDRVDIAYHLEINEWNGRKNLQLNVQDIRPTESD